MPVCVSCPGSVLRLVSFGGGGVARSLPPLASLLVARPLVGGPVRPGRPGAWGILLTGGGPLAAPPLGRGWVWVGWGGSGVVGRAVALPRSVPLPPLYGH